MAIVAAGEGGFIAWRLASSPSGLLGTKGTLMVESKPMGAQVKIDGEVQGITPLSLSIAGGAHVMEIAAGTEPRVIPITVTAGQTLSQYVELVGVSALGRLSIQSAPVGATVLLDGQPRGVTPLELPDVSAGRARARARSQRPAGTPDRERRHGHHDVGQPAHRRRAAH